MAIWHGLPVESDPTVRDAFGRVRVSEPYTILDTKQLFDAQPLIYDEVIVDSSGNATSTHSPTNACTTMYVEANDSVTRQTFMRMQYQPGKSQQAFLTGILGAGAVNLSSAIGLFDDDNGVFFRVLDGVFQVVIRKDGTDIPVDQDDFNLDTLDGTGGSLVDLDLDTCQIFFIDFEWLGVGSVRFGVVVDGAIIYCHAAHHANSVTSVYTSTPNYPIRYEIISTGATGSMTQICSSVTSEGGLNPNGIIRSYSSAKVDANVASTTYALCGLQLKSTHIGSTVDIQGISVFCSTNDNFQWKLIFNPTVASVFTYSDVDTYSCCQKADGATANTVTGGIVIASGYAASQQPLTAQPKSTLRLGSAIDGTLDTIVLAAAPFGNDADIYGTIVWQELT